MGLIIATSRIVNSYKGFLGQIIGIIGIAHQLESREIGSFLVPFDQNPESHRVPLLNRVHQLGIIQSSKLLYASYNRQQSHLFKIRPKKYSMRLEICSRRSF